MFFFFPYLRTSAEEHTRPTTEEAIPSSSSSYAKHESRETGENQEEARPSTSTERNQNEEGENDGEEDEEEKGEVVEAVLTEEDLIQQSQAEYDSGRYSPTLLSSSELPLDSHTITPEEDMHRLQLARRQLQVTGMRLLVDKRAHLLNLIRFLLLDGA